MSHLSVSAPQPPAHIRNCSPICAVSLESVGVEHLDELKRVNEAIFPIKYNDSFYNSVLINSAFSLLDYLYIMTIGVLGQYRKSGIGSALLTALIARATADQTVAHIQLHVQISNENALSFYLKHNFRIVSQVRDYYVFNKGVIPPHAFLLRKNVKEGLNAPADVVFPQNSAPLVAPESRSISITLLVILSPRLQLLFRHIPKEFSNHQYLSCRS
ncbi:hypothetical protein CcCBS67573_g05307 [Chytriomyces confervae]|uniref:N-acetyltransferase domain-containing protein n=1 Tax=Chytriomyces confervae TaxID=246404 RepID=A0A507FAY9_9FUNG|nr:hypothetical protein CcCBS67573_g05307 [Chytriomyces confervae]